LIKTDPLDILDELEYIAALSAAEAFEKLMIGMNAKRRSLLVMKGAETGVTLGCADPPQTDILAHDRDDVDGSFDLRREIQSTNNSAATPAQEIAPMAAPCQRIDGSNLIVTEWRPAGTRRPRNAILVVS